MTGIPKYYGIMYPMGTGAYGIMATPVNGSFRIKLAEDFKGSLEDFRDDCIQNATAAVNRMATRDKITYEEAKLRLGSFKTRVFWVYGPLDDKFQEGVERYVHRSNVYYAVISKDLEAELLQNSYPVEPE